MVTGSRQRGPDAMAYRWASAGIGTLLVVCSASIVLLVPFSNWMAMIAAGILFALGADALVAAKNGRRSMLSRMGPLP